MPDASPARQRLRALMRQPDERLDLAEAALCIAWEDQGQGVPSAGQLQLDELAAAARQRIAGLNAPHEIVSELNHYLFEEQQFRGNTGSYDDPANSFLDQVLARRVGLPITLSVVYLEVGWRLGLAVVGLALPGHFLVRYMAPSGDVFVDPFHRGRLWSLADCEAQIAAVYGELSPPIVERFMTPPTKRDILARILRNLKNTYVERERFEAALACAERLMIVEPRDFQQLRDAGLLRIRMGQLHLALVNFDRYARAVPDASDLPFIQERALIIATHLARRN